MSIKAAIASRDGKFINEHFGRAERFLIFELDGNGYTFIEERASKKICSGGEHEDHDFDATATLLRDCRAIIISKIGFGASNYMESRGFELFEAGMPIEDALVKLNEYYTERGELGGGNV